LFLIFGIVFVFSLGAAGGMWAQAFLLPYVVSYPAFQGMQFVKDWAKHTTVIREVREIIISKEEAVAGAVEKGEKSTVGIASTNGVNTVYGSGLIITADGFIITIADAIPAGYKTTVYVREGEESVAAQLLKRDAAKNLAIVKIERQNLSPVAFARQNSWSIGDVVVMVAKAVEANDLVTIAQEGTVRTKDADMIRTNIFDKQTLQGSPLFNLEGQVVGLNTFEEGGRLVAIPVSVLRDFSGF